MNRFVRNLVALVLALALPLQTVGAATMTLCARDHAPQTTADVAAVAAAAADSDAHEACHSDPTQNVDCNQCSLCHLAGASALPSVMPTLSDALQDVDVAALTINVTSYLPDPVLKPPRGNLR